MKIKINDEDIQFSGNTLIELLEQYGFKEKAGIAVAVNESVIKKDDWLNYALTEDDSILIITPVQGG